MIHCCIANVSNCAGFVFCILADRNSQLLRQEEPGASDSWCISLETAQLYLLWPPKNCPLQIKLTGIWETSSSAAQCVDFFKIPDFLLVSKWILRHLTSNWRLQLIVQSREWRAYMCILCMRQSLSSFPGMCLAVCLKHFVRFFLSCCAEERISCLFGFWRKNYAGCMDNGYVCSCCNFRTQFSKWRRCELVQSRKSSQD